MPGFFPVPPPPKHRGIWGLYFAASVGADLVLLVLVTAMIGYLGSTIYYDANNYINLRDSANWPKTTGKIISSGFYQMKAGYVPSAHFKYTVDGHEYESRNLLFASNGPYFETADAALLFLSPVPALPEETKFADLEMEEWARKTFPNAQNRDVSVYYDPNDHSTATLKREFRMNPDFNFIWVTVPLAVFFSSIFIYSVRSWVRFFRHEAWQ